jgi:hypothetical protein
MQETFGGESLEQALKNNSFSRPEASLVGMVKSSEREGYISFSRAGCEDWVDLPTYMIEEAKKVGQNRCKDHAHPVFEIALKETKNPEGQVLLSLLAQSASSPYRSDQVGPTLAMSAPEPRMTRGPAGQTLNRPMQRAATRGWRGSGSRGGKPQASAEEINWGGGGWGAGGGDNLWNYCWDDCCHAYCAAGHYEDNYGGGFLQWVCDWWVCDDPCQKCLFPW